jgi:hypothetical protein
VETGKFVLEKSHFIAGGRKYCLRKRKRQTDIKPELYLIALQPFQYISSLYATDIPGEYSLDWQKRLYRLVLTESQVLIAEAV